MFNWHDVFKRAYEGGYLATESKTAEQRLLDAVSKGLITEDQRINITTPI